MPRSFFVRQVLFTPPEQRQRWDGKSVIVTGANTGLGLEAARQFVSLGAEKVILAVRSLDKGERAKESIESTTGRSVRKLTPKSPWKTLPM